MLLMCLCMLKHMQSKHPTLVSSTSTSVRVQIQQATALPSTGHKPGYQLKAELDAGGTLTLPILAIHQSLLFRWPIIRDQRICTGYNTWVQPMRFRHLIWIPTNALSISQGNSVDLTSLKMTLDSDPNEIQTISLDTNKQRGWSQ